MIIVLMLITFLASIDLSSADHANSLDPDQDKTERRSPVGNVSDCRYLSNCKSKGRKIDPGPVPYIHGD